MDYTSIKICAGAGEQATGLEEAGFEHIALIEIEPIACQTLKLNRPNWNFIQKRFRVVLQGFRYGHLHHFIYFGIVDIIKETIRGNNNQILIVQIERFHNGVFRFVRFVIS